MKYIIGNVLLVVHELQENLRMKKLIMIHILTFQEAQMGVEIPEEIYDKFLAKLDEDGWIDLPATVIGSKGEIEKVKIRIFKAEG